MLLMNWDAFLLPDQCMLSANGAIFSAKFFVRMFRC